MHAGEAAPDSFETSNERALDRRAATCEHAYARARDYAAKHRRDTLAPAKRSYYSPARPSGIYKTKDNRHIVLGPLALDVQLEVRERRGHGLHRD